MSSQRPSSQRLKQLLARWGFTLDDKRIEQIWRYHTMLRQANEELNMTRIHNFEAMVLKHYVDCLLPTRLTSLPGPLLDMGTGPGLPGIILKIARPDLPMVLADTRSVRCQFLEGVVKELGLKDIEIFSGSISSRFEQKMGGVITRAVAEVPETIRRVRGCLEVGGRLILMKGPDCDAEIRAARDEYGDEFQLVEDHPYILPESTHKRRLLVFERTAVVNRTEGADNDTQEMQSAKMSRQVREIASASNPNYQLCLDIQQGRGIRKHGLALVSGRKMVEEVLKHYPDLVEAWITDRDGLAPPDYCNASVTWLRLTKPLWEELDQFGTRSPMLRVRVPELQSIDLQSADLSGCTLLVPFQDPENVGAVLRSAAAFEVNRVVMLQEAAHPFHPKSLRAGGPPLLGLDIYAGPSIKKLPEMQVPFLALGADGEEIQDRDWPDSFALLPGVEGPGLPDAWPGMVKIGIPIAENVESLNASVATAIALYDWRRR